MVTSLWGLYGQISSCIHRYLSLDSWCSSFDSNESMHLKSAHKEKERKLFTCFLPPEAAPASLYMSASLVGELHDEIPVLLLYWNDRKALACEQLKVRENAGLVL